MAESWPLDGANMSPFRYGMAALAIASIVRVVEASLGMPATALRSSDDADADLLRGGSGDDTYAVGYAGGRIEEGAYADVSSSKPGSRTRCCRTSRSSP
jgi:hypothetical protein